MLDDNIAIRLAEFFRAMGDASRVKIISTLLDGEHSVGEIAKRVGLSDSAVSHHLRSLRHMRLVQYQKVGRLVFYSLDDEHVEEMFLKGLNHILHQGE